MAHAFQIDTLAFSKKLKAAGADDRLAEAIVEGITGADISDLATKSDIREVKTEIADVKTELKADIANVRAEIAGVKASIDLLASTLTVKLGMMMVGGFSLLAVLFGVLGYLLKS